MAQKLKQKLHLCFEFKGSFLTLAHSRFVLEPVLIKL